MTPNWFAYVALLSWPAVAFYLFYKRPLNQAIIWTILGGYLLLPAGTVIKFEMIPAFDKRSIPNIAAFVGSVLITRRLPKLFRTFGFVEILIVMLLAVPFITSVLNGDSIKIGTTVLPGVGVYDAGSALIAEFLVFLPFILGRQYFRTAADGEEILRALVVAGLLLSLPVLFEIRISPQLSRWIYGYLPTGFATVMRDGGFRPVVFMENGLVTTFFLMTAVLAASALWRTKTRLRHLAPGGITAYLALVLIWCKSLGALVYGALLMPAVRWTTPRLQLRVAMALVIISLSYPTLRILDLVPTQFLVDVAASVSSERAESLKFRLENEDQLLRHASERFWFGWGRFGRNRVYEESGRDFSVTDGEWIIRLGIFGFFGFLAEFGLFGLCVFRAAAASKALDFRRDAVFTAALSSDCCNKPF